MCLSFLVILNWIVGLNSMGIMTEKRTLKAQVKQNFMTFHKLYILFENLAFHQEKLKYLMLKVLIKIVIRQEDKN